MKKNRSIFVKGTALFLALNIAAQVFYPTAAYALTGGPSQPEVTQFAPVSASDMVDIFTGDFNHNIPLFELPGPNGGYPFNLSYQSAPSMDQEASWVGLGWNINPGAIVRNLRGLPDDFSGQKVQRQTDMKPNITVGVSGIFNVEVTGGDGAKAGFSVTDKIYYNTYKGIGYSSAPGLSLSTATKGNAMTAGLGFNLSFDSQDGGVGANLNLSVTHEKNSRSGTQDNKTSLGLGLGFNTNSGMNFSQTFSSSRRTKDANRKPSSTRKPEAALSPAKGNFGIPASSSISFALPTANPEMGIQMNGLSFSAQFTYGFDPAPNGSTVYIYSGFGGFVDVETIANPVEFLPAYGYLNYENKNTEGALMDFNREKDGIIRKSTPNLAAPVLTHDYYNVLGQGTGGTFRAYRPEVGYVHQQERRSSSGGGNLGFNVSNVLEGKKLGVNASVNFSETSTGKWDAALNEISNDPSDPDAFGVFRRKQADNVMNYEGAYFKMHGDLSALPVNELAYLQYEEAVRFEMAGDVAKRQLKNIKRGISSAMTTDRSAVRRERSQLISPFYNRDIVSSSSGVSSMYEMDIRYFDAGTSSNIDLYDDRTNRERSDIGGFVTTNPDGTRYVYGLPAYNNVTTEHIYSARPDEPGTCQTYQELPLDGSSVKYKHAGTDEFKSVTEVPDYVHAHLLTSVLGTDYVDMDNTAGPSDGDYGYWVKFNYKKTSEDFHWRTPFNGANYSEGSRGTYADDKISFNYGEKEIWYLGTVETKTHIAVFEISERRDGFGPAGDVQSGMDASNPLYKLDKIKLYAKEDYISNSEAVPIQTVHFEYDYSLCPGVPNNSGVADYNKDVRGNNGPDMNTGTEDPENEENTLYGKLTLKAVYFTYKNDHSGQRNKYKFTYAANYNGDGDDSNRPYAWKENKYDRWGTYNWYTGSGQCANMTFPYTPQFYQAPYPAGYTPDANFTNDKEKFKQSTDEAAASWTLTRIDLPSGGSINIEYESDDYAYVQHKKATQMFKITSLGIPGSPDKIYDQTPDCRTKRKVYFKLETPILASLPLCTINQQIFDQYVEPMRVPDTDDYQVYINARVKLRGNVWQDVGAYYLLDTDNEDCANGCPIADNPGDYDGDGCYPNECAYGVADITQTMTDGTTSGSYYTHGYVILDRPKVEGNYVDYHPIALNSWYYMKSTLPSLLTQVNDPNINSNESDMMNQMGSLLSVMPQIIALFAGFENDCHNKKLANEIDLQQSWIKLGAPDGIKYGGGQRVKKIYMEDDAAKWEDDAPSTDRIGQVYEYTMDEGGRTISSGVAAYEPSMGSEENALKYAKFYLQNVPMKSGNDLFFEHPVNESYFPAPQVGYRKVTVRSLATDLVKNDPEDTGVKGIMGTGQTVHEFYTAKEFPTIVEETDLQIHQEPMYVPIPLVGTYTDNRIRGSQGYVIRLNDMHGRQKSITTHGINPDGSFSPQPTSKVEYIYKTKQKVYQGMAVMEVDNIVDVLIDDPNLRGEASLSGTGANVQQRLMGLDYEFFYDMRQTKVEAGGGGLDFNIELFLVLPATIPFFTIWPSFNSSFGQTNLVVANKIIHKRGIPVKTIVTDGQSVVTTHNLVFDPVTGEPLLSAVNNNFDNPVYNYSIPSHLLYSGMSGASKNALIEFKTDGASIDAAENTLTIADPGQAFFNINGSSIGIGDVLPYLHEGDEFVIHTLEQTTNDPITRRVYLNHSSGGAGTDCVASLTGSMNFYVKGNVSDLNPGAEYRFLLVRSGMRNLLSQKLGSIVSLSTDGVTGSPMSIGNSPLMNRNLETLSTGTVPVGGFTTDLAAFLTHLLDGNGQLPLATFTMNDPQLFSGGSPLFPTLNQMLDFVTISATTATSPDGPCAFENQLDCYYNDGGTQVPAGYSITLKFNTAFGAGCCHRDCFARRFYSDGSPTQINGFTYDGNNIDMVISYDREFGEVHDCINCYTDVWNQPYSTGRYRIKNILQAAASVPADTWGEQTASRYAVGNAGIWRMQKDHYYKDDRLQNPNNIVATVKDGVFDGESNDTYFQLFNWYATLSRPLSAKWIRKDLVTTYNRNGAAVETKDILEISSSVLFDRNENLPTAIAQNSRRQELLHFNFDNDDFPVSGDVAVSSICAFTGEQSLQVNKDDEDIEFLFDDNFRPDDAVDNEYLISVWTGGYNMYYSPLAIDLGHPTAMNITLNFYNGMSLLGTETFRPSGLLYEGRKESYWRRLEGRFTVPAGTNRLVVNFGDNDGMPNELPSEADDYAFYDDFRIQPSDALMKTFVYDNTDFRLRAELNENNFPTYYGYDAAGQLSIVKVLTEGGIKTVKEIHTNIKKQ